MEGADGLKPGGKGCSNRLKRHHRIQGLSVNENL